MRRIAVTAGRSPLGRCVADALRASPEVEQVRSIETRPSRDDSDDDLDVVSLTPDHRPFAEYLEKQRIDTVIQCGLVPDRSGLGSSARGADVITTMCVGAAIGDADCCVRSWILASSSHVYPIGSQSPLLQQEQQDLPRGDEPLAATIGEAESYARDVARRRSYLNVAIMRLQQLVGPGVRGPLASLLARNPVPTPMGFDPAIQLLHLEDAASALAFAAQADLAGTYNVASAGVIRCHDAVLAAGRNRFAVLPMSAGLLEPLLGRLGIPVVPAELLALLRFGHAVDTKKIERTGWQPAHDQLDCLSLLRPD